MNSKISIIVPCYNQAEYLPEALQSVLNQTYQNWECIIVNDGSPDNTKEVALEWVKKDSRFIYLYKENGGLSSARNAGIANAEGEFILPLDADDKVAPKYLELAIQSFEIDTALKVVYCKAKKFGNELGIWQLAPFSIYDLGLYNMIFCSAVFKKKDWELVGGYDVNLIYGLEDWEFWIAILKNGGAVKCIDEVGFYYRIKEKSMLKSMEIREADFSKDYIRRKHLDFFISNYSKLNQKRKKAEEQLKSEKFVINLFGKTFFNFQPFTKHKIE
nr:glycosyltransferase family A protein [uncultured Flavobacterium sp.]